MNGKLGAERVATKRAEAEANLKASLPQTILPNDVMAAEAQTLTSTIVTVEAQILTSNIATQTSTSNILAVCPQKKNERREEVLAQRCTSKG